MKHKLILIDGQSTVGKSTTSKSVYEQIAHQDKAYWLHEECEEHPIRYKEFEAGSIYSLDGMELNRQAMLKKWEQFSKEINKSNQVCITEGCFLHSLDRYLLKSSWNEEQITSYFKQVLEIIEPLNPLIVFLYRPDITVSFEKAFRLRGDWWRELILKVPEASRYFETHDYTGNDSIFASLTYEQEQMSSVFDSLSCNKLKIDTTDEFWDNYIREITEAAGYKYIEIKHKLPEVEKYCGTYQIESGEDIWHIGFDVDAKRMYTSLFWPYMPMKYIGSEQFELISFPVTLKFDIFEEKLQFIISGNYDWEYNGKRFIKI